MKKIMAILVVGFCLASFTEIGLARTFYIGTKNTKMYHQTDCVLLKKARPQERVGFRSVKQALHAGFRPCKACKAPLTD